MPDTAEYLTRIRNYSQGKDQVSLRVQTPTVLAELVAGATDQQLTKRPSKEQWSIAEILAHLAEDEIATAWRYRQMVEHSGIERAGFDQDLWARIAAYASRVPQEPLALFRLLAARTCNSYSSSRRSSGSALGFIPSAVGARSGSWPSIRWATTLIILSKSGRSWINALLL